MARSNPLAVHGLRELNRAFKAAGTEARVELRTELARVAEPVRADAEASARRDITRIGDRWSAMRTGVTQKVVYIAPRARNRGGPKRPNLARLLIGQMEASLERHRADVEHAAERVLDQVGRRFETR